MVKEYVIRLNRNRILSQQNIQSGSINSIFIPELYACSSTLFPHFLENFLHAYVLCLICTSGVTAREMITFPSS